jgi:hypothetical protein
MTLAGCLDPHRDSLVGPSERESRPIQPLVRFVEVATFPGSFPWREPWSPHGRILVFGATDGLHAFDADDAASPPLS